MTEPERWTCPDCGGTVGSERVLQLTEEDEMRGWHPGCFLRCEAQP